MWWWLPLALAQSPEVDPADTRPWSPREPAAQTVRMVTHTHTLLDGWGGELFVRGAVSLEVRTEGRRRTWTLVPTVSQRVVQTSFGLVRPEELAELPPPGGVRWTTDGAELEEVVPLDPTHPMAAIQAAVGAAPGLRVPRPPKRVRPGDTWSHAHRTRVPVETDELEGWLLLHLASSATFVGWTVDGDVALDVTDVVQLMGQLTAEDHTSQVGGVARARTTVVVDPADGLALWAAQRGRLRVAAGGSGDPDETTWTAVVARER